MEDPQVRLLEGLQTLGFTSVEALAYRELMRQPDQSGYRLAKAIGKSQGNTYQALSSLLQKGAVLANGTEPTRYRAVPAPELLGRLKRRFESTCDGVGAALAELQPRPAEGVMTRLQSRDQVLERCRRLLLEARETVVFEAFPGSFEALRPEFAQAVERLGQACAGLVMTEPDLGPSANVAVSRRAEVLLATLEVDHLALAVDGLSFLFAQFDRRSDALRRGVFISDPVLCLFLHSALVSDVVLHRSEAIDVVGSPGLHLLGKFPHSHAFMSPDPVERKP